ncbi:hypothetical protein GW758_00225 [Candidatus Falkowbacteria bacterium]|nr:hypothetical protein [Candidatus Falkowbacteria bacterium]NCT54371.1 hypothetical protein [Candidatus Falkowbacteria bacterium]
MFSFKKKQNSKQPSAQSDVKPSPKEKVDDFDASKNPEILEVNLVKDEIIVLFDWNKHLFLTFLVLIFTGAFVFEIYLGLDYWEERENQRSQEIKEETNKIRLETIELNNKSQDALSFKDKSSAFSDLLDNHIYWTRFFTWLESNTLNTVQFGSFDGNLSGSYSLAASAPSFAEASWQVKVLADNKNVKKASVNSVSSKVIDGDNLEDSKVGSVSFSIDLEIDPTIFKKSK